MAGSGFARPKSSLESSISKLRPDDLVMSSWWRVLPFARTMLVSFDEHNEKNLHHAVQRELTYTSNFDLNKGIAAATSGHAGDTVFSD
jgi:hypothetical protein